MTRFGRSPFVRATLPPSLPLLPTRGDVAFLLFFETQPRWTFHIRQPRPCITTMQSGRYFKPWPKANFHTLASMATHVSFGMSTSLWTRSGSSTTKVSINLGTAL